MRADALFQLGEFADAGNTIENAVGSDFESLVREHNTGEVIAVMRKLAFCWQQTGRNREASELLRRVTTSDAFERMPPEGDALAPDQVALLRRWVNEGAEYEQHWAYRPVKEPARPAVRDETWVRNPIDSFVLAQLEQAGILPSPEADRPTLIKRLHYDLIGLPPSLKE